ncbi:quaternary amine ABC transporter ATP-binding protein [Candidatus Viridilinea mediisalina]|nr:glycine betaine/L-proline ABC transporter ATP-binding protein [Candidatus Viridilinea mediisalina]
MNESPPNVMPPKIVCRDVWKIFGRSPRRIFKALATESTPPAPPEGHIVAVRGVSFEVRPGETFVVMGLSGSGKSTLVRCISRITEPTHGEILVDGQDVLRMRPLELRELRRNRISMVFQHFGLFPHRRVIDNVAYGLEVRGVPRPKRRERAAQVLELVGLQGWEYHFPRQLSGGMQQRVGLARALAVDPDILLFDEPFSALDPLIRREMQEELQRLQATLHKTSIFITHDFTEALKLGDKVAVMRHGQIVQVGTPQELVLNPINDYVGAFVRDAPRGRVLTAQAVMTKCNPVPPPADRPTISAHTYLDDLLPLMAAYGDPVAVTDGNGFTIGHVDRAGVLKALIRE